MRLMTKSSLLNLLANSDEDLGEERLLDWELE